MANPRYKKPTALKILQGTYRADRATPNEPKPEPGIPPAPDILSPEARAEWDRITPQLYKAGLLAEIDRAALAAYCEAWSDWVDATIHCATLNGVDRKVYTTVAGHVIENPYFSIKKRCAEIMGKLLAEFGCTPASRTRISSLIHQPDATASKEEDPHAEFRLAN